MKYLFPWEKIIGGEKYIREVFGSNKYYFSIWINDNKNWTNGHVIFFDGPKSIMRHMDKWFLENGYSFIAEGDVERFREKLSVLL